MVNTPSVPKPGTNTPAGVYLRRLVTELLEYLDSATTKFPSAVATPERKAVVPPSTVNAIAPSVPNVESRVGFVPRTPGAPVVQVGIPPPPLGVMENVMLY